MLEIDGFVGCLSCWQGRMGFGNASGAHLGGVVLLVFWKLPERKGVIFHSFHKEEVEPILAGGRQSQRGTPTFADDQWTWGPDGKGAVLLVNCDRDNPTAQEEDNKDNKLTSMQGRQQHPLLRATSADDRLHLRWSQNGCLTAHIIPQSYHKWACRAPMATVSGSTGIELVLLLDLEDMSRMILTTQGPNEVFANYQLTLHISKADDDKVGSKADEAKTQRRSLIISYDVKQNLGQVKTVFYVEGLKFPDIDFSGLVTFHASLLEPARKGVPETSIFTDTLVFRVAPWIMTPNTLQPVSVYVCR
ncbi:Protein-arginine deiminase type-2, partial [Ophiophagus hannah]